MTTAAARRRTAPTSIRQTVRRSPVWSNSTRTANEFDCDAKLGESYQINFQPQQASVKDKRMSYNQTAAQSCLDALSNATSSCNPAGIRGGEGEERRACETSTFFRAWWWRMQRARSTPTARPSTPSARPWSQMAAHRWSAVPGSWCATTRHRRSLRRRLGGAGAACSPPPVARSAPRTWPRCRLCQRSLPIGARTTAAVRLTDRAHRPAARA